METVFSGDPRDRRRLLGIQLKAELTAMSSIENELMWAKQLCTDLSLTTPKPMLWGDSESANLLAVNPISSDWSNHI